MSATLARELLAEQNGPFEIGAVVELGDVKAVGKAPEVEDHLFDPVKCVRDGTIGQGKFWKLLKANSKKTLKGIFGEDIESRSKGCTVDVGKGIASLGNLVPKESPTSKLEGDGKIRMIVKDGEFSVDLSVTDLRFYEDDPKTAKKAVVKDVTERLAKDSEVILSVGLARAFQAHGDIADRHWLQLNNIHFNDGPV